MNELNNNQSVRRSLNEVYQNILENKVIEEWAPMQRSVGQAIKQKTQGGLGGVQSNANNKLITVYKNVWKEYITQVKTQRGMGNKDAQSLQNLMTFLIDIGTDQTHVASVRKLVLGKVQPAAILDNKTAGNFIYKCLQQHYQLASSTTQYQLPQSL